MSNGYKDYQYSPIRMKFVKTGEVFNIGVIVMDEFGANRELRIIDSFDDISKCLRITDPTSHNFMLNLLKTHYADQSFQFGAEFSNTMHIETPEWIYSDVSISNAANDLFNELVTIKRHTASGIHIGDNTPTKVVTSLKDLALEKQYKRINFRRKIPAAFNKHIDAIVYADDAENDAAIGVEVCTPAVDNYIVKGSFSMMALLKAKEENAIKDAVLYMPAIGYQKTTDRKDFNDLRRSIEKQGVTVIKTEDYNTFFGELNQRASGYGTRLF